MILKLLCHWWAAKLQAMLSNTVILTLMLRQIRIRLCDTASSELHIILYSKLLSFKF